jgi:hypothetical protein
VQQQYLMHMQYSLNMVYFARQTQLEKQETGRTWQTLEPALLHHKLALVGMQDSYSYNNLVSVVALSTYHHL